MSLNRTLARVLATATAAAGLAVIPAAAHAATPAPYVAHVRHHGTCGVTPTSPRRWTVKCPRDGFKRVLRPCRQEDSRNCYWDAQRAGNKVGRSFIDVRGRVSYLRVL